MRIPAILVLSALLLSASASLSIFGHNWSVYDPSDWKVDQQEGMPVLHLEKGREPLPGPRRPFQFALADTENFKKVTVEADIQPYQKSMIVVFAYVDPAHFDYAHFSTDTGIKQPVHNGIFHVYGGERVRISAPAGPPAFAASNRWYHVQLTYDGDSGSVQVTVDGQPVPALQAVDSTRMAGRVGLGSFDETGAFRNVTITGTP
jgi:hypothetical protein